MTADHSRLGALARLENVTLDRVVRSARFRTMHMLGRLEVVRTLTGMGLRREREVSSTVFPAGSVERGVADLKRDGVAFGFDLPTETRDEILDWASRTPVYGNLEKAWGFHVNQRKEAERRAGKAFTVAHFYNATSCPAIARLVNDPVVNEIALRYIGPRAKFVSTHAWWSFATHVAESERNEFAQQFHFDLDDYRFIKFFFYLTDVDASSGPHVYMRGTHARKKLRHRYPMRRLSDKEVLDTYGREHHLVVTGGAGTGFIVDTYGIHKGEPPRDKDRLVLQLMFAQHHWGWGDDVADPAELSLL